MRANYGPTLPKWLSSLPPETDLEYALGMYYHSFASAVSMAADVRWFVK